MCNQGTPPKKSSAILFMAPLIIITGLFGPPKPPLVTEVLFASHQNRQIEEVVKHPHTLSRTYTNISPIVG